MASGRSVVVVGGTSGLGKEIARHYVATGADVVLTGRDGDRARAAATELGGSTTALAFDLERPHEIAAAFADVTRVDHLVLSAIDRDQNSVRDYDVDRALRLVTQKLVGYTETVHALLPCMSTDASVVMFGGRALERPYPGSTTVSTVNGGVVGLVNTLAVELAPIRVNAIHPGIVGDSPFWTAKPPEVLEGYRSRTPTGQLASMRDIVDAVDFLLRNRAVNGTHLAVDGGWLLT
ncbi:MAG: SDR family NAD(P)-dependent oxidoreductase [Actinomycetes bacterium]